MLFNSLNYLVFFPIVLLIYFVLPKKARYLWLLAASYYFYACWNAKYALLLLFSTVVTYASGLLIASARKRGKKTEMKLWVAGSFVVNLGILAVFKYSGFVAENVNALMAALGSSARMGAPDVLLPVGISFYTFQALSYTADVYRAALEEEHNFFLYALYVSFFPQLVAGPIERSTNLLPQMKQAHEFDAKRARRGLLLIAWGLFMKMVVADNLAPLVEEVYAGFAMRSGSEIVLATILFAFQIYCDFAGYSTIAIGSADVLGVDLMRNFDQPYQAVSVRDFWRRWHISLTTWFTDYLYIPLGGNRRGKARKALNVMLVFFVSGLWHGANWTYVLWGVCNGLLIVLGDWTRSARDGLWKKLHISPEGAARRTIGRVCTFAMICATWVFFRAQTVSDAFAMFSGVFTRFDWQQMTAWVSGWGLQTQLVCLLSLLALLVTDALMARGVNVPAKIQQAAFPVRWVVYLALLFAILIFGVYGSLFTSTQFLYFQF